MLGPGSQDDTSCTEDLTSSAITISWLPPELLLLITEYLPLSTVISLQLTSKHLYQATPLPKAYHAQPAFHALPLCEQKALRRNLNEAADLATGRRRCLLCNCLLHLRFFPNDGAMCDLHDGRHMSTSLPPGLDESTKARLQRLAGCASGSYCLTLERLLCLHTGRVVQWDVPACECGCDSCAHVSVICYLRISNSSLGPSGWWLKSVDGGERRVLEHDKEFGESSVAIADVRGRELRSMQSPGGTLERSRTVPVVPLGVAEKFAGTSHVPDTAQTMTRNPTTSNVVCAAVSLAGVRHTAAHGTACAHLEDRVPIVIV